jgi:hypothetical protein
MTDDDGLEIDEGTLEAVFELWSSTPNDDLSGISPNALAGLLEDPFEATDVLVFADVLPRVPAAPVATLAGALFDALLVGPAQATASGYLPRAWCQTIERRAFEAHGVLPLDARRRIVTGEAACTSLHVVRLMATVAGLLRSQRGAFELTRRGRALYERRGLAGVYPALLRAFATRLEWSSLDDYPRAPLIQASFGFSLMLVARYGAKPRPATFYSDRWLEAFPGIDEGFEVEAGGEPHRSRRMTPSQRFADCYRLRVLQRFMAYFGLVDLRRVRPGAGHQVVAAPLLAEAVALRHGR